jgi:hypothetical protein
MGKLIEERDDLIPFEVNADSPTSDMKGHWMLTDGKPCADRHIENLSRYSLAAA